MATWAVVKAQARDLLGINLTDARTSTTFRCSRPTTTATSFKRRARPAAGRHADGAPMASSAPPTTVHLVEGNRAAPIDLTNAVRTGHQFLIDIAHNAAPVFDAAGNLVPDADSITGNAPTNQMTSATISLTTTSCSTRTTSPATDG